MTVEMNKPHGQFTQRKSQTGHPLIIKCNLRLGLIQTIITVQREKQAPG